MSALGGLTANPLLRHEWLGRLRLSRRLGRTVAQRRLVVGGLALLYAALVGLTGWAMAENPGEAEGAFPSIGVLLILFYGLTAPGVAATAIAGERQRGTWDMLLATRLTPAEVVRGKFLGRVGALALVMLAPLPVLLVAAVVGVSTGRFEWAFVPGTFVVPMATLLGLTAIGLLCSARAKTTLSAMVGAYVVTLLLFVVMPLMESFPREMAGIGGDPVVLWITCPFATLAGWYATFDGSVSDGAPLALFGPLFYLALALFGLLLLTARFDDWLRYGEGRR